MVSDRAGRCIVGAVVLWGLVGCTKISVASPSAAARRTEPGRIVVKGEVLRPGTYDTNGPLSALEAVERAGGFTPVACQRQVLVRRASGAGASAWFKARVRFTAPLTSELVVHAGDEVTVALCDW